MTTIIYYLAEYDKDDHIRPGWTLVDTRFDIADSVNFALEQFGLEQKTVEEVTAAVGYGVDNLIRKCLNNSNRKPPSIKKVIQVFRDHYAAHCADKSELYPGVRSFLRINSKLNSSVLSNKPEEFCRMILEGLNIIKYFKLVVGGDTTPHKKPHPCGVELILDKFKIKKDEAIMVGDSDPDITVSKVSGIKSVGILNGMGNTDRLIKSTPDYLINKFGELNNLLEKLNSAADPL